MSGDSPTTAMILAAGLGQRLRPLTDHTPKPLIDVGGTPLIERHLGALADAGVRTVVINTHHLAEQFPAKLGNGKRWGLDIHYSYEPELLETGGGIANARPLLGTLPFWLLLGDIACDFPLGRLPVELGSDLMHMVLTPTPPHRQRGDFAAAEGRVTGRGNDFVYTGIAVVSPALLDPSPAGAFSLRDLFFPAVEADRVSCQIWDGFWTDIGSTEQLQAARDWAAHRSHR